MGETSKASDAAPIALGFLTVVDYEQLGLVGGYLILNSAGRPIEFHCTAPVKPSRAQQILFGPTLAPYLYGEQIGQALIAKGAIQPAIVWTDQPPVLAAREFVEPPMGLLIDAGRHPDELTRYFDAPIEFPIGSHRVAIANNFTADQQLIVDVMAPLSSFDLVEPFGRIRDALEEAHRAAAARQAA